MRNTTLGFFIAAISITAHAELLLPHGKDLPLPNGVHSDTLDAETFVTGSYLIPGMTEAQSLVYWRNRLPSTKFTFNTQTKQYLSHDKGIVVRYDSAGLTYQVLADSRYDAGGAVHTVTYRGYDPLRRQVTEYVYAGLTNPVMIDSTRWVWNHPGCADEFRADSRWVWNVDSTGHCSDGSFLMPDPTKLSGWSEDHRLKLQWQGRFLIAAFEVVYGDTLTRDEYIYNRDNLVQSISTYCLGSTWYLAENTSFTYAAGGRMAKRTMQGFDSSGTMFAKSMLASRQLTAEIVTDDGKGGGALRAWRRGDQAVFSNNTDEPLHIAVLAPDGTRRASLLVQPRQKLEWADRSTNGVLLWVARGASYSGSGTLLPAR